MAYALRMEARRQQQEAERLGGAGAQVRKTKFKIYELTSITEIEAQERREAGVLPPGAEPPKPREPVVIDGVVQPELDLNDIIGAALRAQK